MIYFLSFIVVLGILIFVHEFGHFIVARKLGVGVTKFSFGFGPEAVRRPAGRNGVPGFRRARSAGTSSWSGKAIRRRSRPEQAERSFSNKPTWVKMAVVAAGPVGNLLFALLVFWIVFLGGVPALSTKIGDVLPDTPAARAGLLKGDVVLRIDGAAVANWEELADRIRRAPPTSRSSSPSGGTGRR